MLLYQFQIYNDDIDYLSEALISAEEDGANPLIDLNH